MLATLLTLLGIAVSDLIANTQEQQITAINKKLNSLRTKNDKKSSALYEKATNLIASNNYLASKLPKYAKIINKDTRDLERRRADIINKQHDINNDIENAQTSNNARYNLGIIGKIRDIHKANKNQENLIKEIDKEI